MMDKSNGKRAVKRYTPQQEADGWLFWAARAVQGAPAGKREALAAEFAETFASTWSARFSDPSDPLEAAYALEAAQRP